MNEVTMVDHIRIELMYTLLCKNVNLHTILHYHGIDAAGDGKYSTLAAMKSSNGLDYIIYEELRNKLHI